MKETLRLIRDSVREAKALQETKHLSTIEDLRARIDNLEKEKEVLLTKANASGKLVHFYHQAITEEVKDTKLARTILDRVFLCIDKYAHLSYSDLVKKNDIRNPMIQQQYSSSLSYLERLGTFHETKRYHVSVFSKIAKG